MEPAVATVELNPRLLVCDTDALIQIFIADQGELLKKARRLYGIQPAIPESVEDELTRLSQPKRALFADKAKKALDNQALIVLDERSIGAFTSNDRHSTYNSVQILGQKNSLKIGPGEAYVHAAGLVLRAPALSNDAKAVNDADRLGIQIAPYVLRAYDLFVLFHQIGELSDSDCDEVRKKLAEAKEDAVPAAFKNRKFADGLPHFCQRLVDGDLPRRAGNTPQELGDLNKLVIRLLTPRAVNETGKSVATLGDVWPDSGANI
jgi:hypothetical protein